MMKYSIASGHGRRHSLVRHCGDCLPLCHRRVAAVRTVLGWVPSEPKGDGMATFFAGLVLLVILSVTLFALLEAGLLVSLVR